MHGQCVRIRLKIVTTKTTDVNLWYMLRAFNDQLCTLAIPMYYTGQYNGTHKALQGTVCLSLSADEAELQES